ncbi:MAG TPA: Uma2 family endonuclease [Pyrinomonadaceae bacterium]|jgi:Uma2 family endonuclease|nr:Uma2 family endonuclease [Pyrinomonadaceae bacterium]
MSVAEKVFETDSALVVRAGALGLTDEKFFELCLDNPTLRLEMTAKGELIVMGPTASETGRRNSSLNFQLYFWARDAGAGICFDSSAGFTLPNGAKVSPDASWIRRERYEALTEDEREQFAPICADFVVELRSKTDRLARLQAKMLEYVENGAQLGWLIDPAARRVYVYRPGQEVETLDAPETVAGDPVLPNFLLQLREIW